MYQQRWKHTDFYLESKEVLWQKLTQQDIATLKDFYQANDHHPLENLHPQRQKEWLCSRFFLSKILKKPLTAIQFNPLYQVGKDYCSLSHDPNFIAVLISQIPCGLDLENDKRTVKQAPLIQRFLKELPNEFSTLQKWTLAESLYKWAGQNGENLEYSQLKFDASNQLFKYKGRIAHYSVQQIHYQQEVLNLSLVTTKHQ